MNILFDHNVPRRLGVHLTGHTIATAKSMGWEKLSNGVLLQGAAAARFDAFITIDKKLEHEQNLMTLPLPVIVLDAQSNALPALLPFVAPLLNLLSTPPLALVLYIVQEDGTILRLTAPRP